MENRIIKKFKTKFSNWFSRSKADRIYTNIITVGSMSEIPPLTDANIYIVERNGVKRWAVFQCPKHLEERIEVNLMRSKKPYWEIKIINNKVSLWPSVSVNSDDCNDHFWLENNRAYLVKGKRYAQKR